MKVGVVGHTGRIGSELVALGCVPLLCDVLDFDETQAEIEKAKPNIIVNCSGKADVNWVCASDTNYEAAFKLAVRGTANLQVKGIGLIGLSSDHVFNGKRGKYRENDRPDPVNDYGLTKIALEALMLTWGGKVVRLSTCFGSDLIIPPTSPTFISRSYAHYKHIAEGLFYIAQNYEKMPEIIHLAGTETLSMYEFHLAVATTMDADKSRVIPRKKEEAGFAPRPRKGGLNVSLARRLGVPLYSAYDGLELCRQFR